MLKLYHFSWILSTIFLHLLNYFFKYTIILRDFVGLQVFFCFIICNNLHKIFYFTFDTF